MIGFTPAQIDAMSLWEFNACATGFGAAHNPKPKAADFDDDDVARFRDLGVAGL